MNDTQARWLFLDGGERAVLSLYALKYGPLPPPDVFSRTWRDLQTAKCDAILECEFAACCDAFPPEFLQDMQHVRAQKVYP